MDKLQEIAKLRCMNKPVKYIAKRVGMDRDDVEKYISDLIIKTDPFLKEIVKGRKASSTLFDISPLIEMSDLSVDYAKLLLGNEKVLDYVAVKMNDHHDRYMDCIRYHAYILMKKEAK
ncbi:MULTISPECIES: hypothetical protein [Acidianus]|uniref:Uncharacterized protein n=1 Tax=Candidatus Acidianus copahuensis TaxID=1160895 RepID=A0A031LRV2_9CREN|nr:MULTISPECIES: hypothetical protein [Acidianus]EZQ10546.1 hypothetical protein CM19_03665 [Candidatus Acidianus copahuensis]NON62995.1 hypothetical protein [Acidianus sp. RZ1]